MPMLRAFCEGLYGRWLETRSFLIGLRLAWVSTASAALGFLLFFSAPPAQDILLEVRDDVSAGLFFWAVFYLVVILLWALPVFVSARWILTRLETNSDLRPNMEPVPAWVRNLVPAFLAVVCFVAVLAGQIVALGTAPTIDENAQATIDSAKRFVRDKNRLRESIEACRNKLSDERCKTLVTRFAVVAGDSVFLGGRRNVPKVALGIGAFLIFWLYIGRSTAVSRFLPARVARRTATAVAAYLVIAFTVYQVVVQFVEKWSGPSPSLTFVPLLAAIPVIVWLAWRGHERWLWWIGSVFGIVAGALIFFGLYGIVEAERSVPFSPVHLFLLPFVTVALAALTWWGLGRRHDRQPTRLGQMLLRLGGSKGDLSDNVATARLVNPVFYVLLGITVVLNILFVLVDPLQLTGVWHLNRGFLLSVVLGFPVAALTYLTYLSMRCRAPLIAAAIVLLGALSIVRGWLWDDYYAIRAGDPLTVARPTLDDAVKQWAKANGCNPPKLESVPAKPCPAPIIVTAAGGASRAAFHVAGVIGALMDERLSPLRDHRGSVFSAAFSTDGGRIVTASLDATARIWDGRTGAQLAVLRGHNKRVYDAQFSPDGQRVVTASWDGTAKIWDISNLREIKEIKELKHPRDVNTASFSSDNKLIVTSSDDAIARIWDADTGAEVALFKGHEKLVHSAAFSRDGKHIVTAAWDHTARIWTVPTQEQIKRIIDTRTPSHITTSTVLGGHTNDVNSAAFSPDGKLIVTASDDRTARIWDAKTGLELARLEKHRALVFRAAFSPDSKRVVTAAWDHTARVWDVPTPEEIRTLAESKSIKRITENTPLRGHTLDVNSAVFRPDGKVIVTASDDKTARIWDPKTGLRKEWEADRFPSFAKQLFAFSAVSGGSVGASVVYAALADSQLSGQSSPGAPPCSKESLRDEDWFGSGQRVGQSGASLEPLEPSEDPQKSWKACLQLLVAGDFLSPAFVGLTRDPFHPLWMTRGDRAQLLELAWEDRYERFTRSETSKRDGKVSTLARPLSAIRRDLTSQNLNGWLPILFLNGTLVDDGKRLITSDIEASVRDRRGKVTHRVFRDAHDFHELYLPPRVRGHWAPIRSVAVSPDGTRIVSASDDRTARIWDAETGAELAVLNHDKRVNDARFNADGTRVVTASWDRTAVVWDVSNLNDVKRIRELKHRRDVNGAAFSPDGRLVVTAADDAAARLWDAETGDLKAELPGHKNFVYSAVFDAAGKRVVTASWDGTAKVWDVSNPGGVKELTQLKGHTREVYSAAFSPDGKLIVTASADKTARIWDSETGELRAVLPGHGGVVSSAVFSPDGKRVLTGAWDHIVRIWDVSDLAEVKETKRFRAHGDHVNAVAFGRDGSLVISGSRDRTVRISAAEIGDAQAVVLESYRDGRWTGCENCDIRLSTAATMSARFPVISPSGTIPGYDKKTIRVVDGGYHENFGATTAMELADFLEKEHGLHAAVVFVNNDPAAPGMECVMPDGGDLKAVNSWLWDPLVTIMGTQTARGSHAAVSLCDSLGGDRFAFVTIDPSKPYVTLSVSWWMSKTVQHYLDRQLAYNSRAFATIARMRQDIPEKHKQARQSGALTLLEAPKGDK